MLKQALVLVPLLVLVLPSASAQESDSVRIYVDADEMAFQTLEPVSGSRASKIRQEMDREYGNGDGIVQAGEVTAYQDDHRYTFSQDRPECFERFELVRIDGLPPTRLSELREEIIGATNTRADSTAPLHEVTHIRFVYPRPDSSSPTVTLALGAWDSYGMAMACQFGGGQTWGTSQWWTPGPGQPTTRPPRTVPAPPEDLQTASGAEQQGGDGDTIFLVRPLPGARIDPDTIRPTSMRSLWDSQGLRADSDAERASLMSNRITFTVEGGLGSGGPSFTGTARDVGAAIGYATVGVASLGAVAALVTEFGRYKLWKLLFLVPGFTRLEKDEVLEHTKRDELYRFIKTNPGPSFSDLRRELALSNGTLVHHLRILESQEYVKSVRDGFRTRFYVRGPKIVPSSYLTRTQQQLLEAIGANPGLTQKQLTQVLGLPRESISYHTKQLAAKGKLQIKQEGKWRRYWPSTEPSPAGGAYPQS